MQEALADAVERINQTRSDVDAVTAKLRAREEKDKKERKESTPETAPSPAAGLIKSGRELRKKLDEIEKRLWAPEGIKGILPDTNADARINYAARAIGSSFDAPTPAQLGYLELAETETRKVLDDLNKLFAEDVAAYRAKVKELDVQLLREEPPISIGG